MSEKATVRELGEFAYIVDGLDEPWLWKVDHPAVIETVPTKDSLGVYVREPIDILNWLRKDANRDQGRDVLIPMIYDGKDLAELCDRLGIDVATEHAKGNYECHFLGFLPGFPYLGGLPSGLSGLPRRDSPRTHVPARSVAITGEYCGIYPKESPGGWWLIGTTTVPVCDVEANYFLVKPGDRVRFEAVT